jgi:hypothetical protein
VQEHDKLRAALYERNPEGERRRPLRPDKHFMALLAVHHLQQGVQRRTAVQTHDSLVVFGPVRGAAILNNYSPKIMTDGIESRSQNTDGSGYACHQHHIHTKGSKRLIQIGLKECAEAAFGQDVILGISVEFNNDRFPGGAPQAMRLHFPLEDKIIRQKAVACENDRKLFFVESIDQSVQSREESPGAPDDKRLRMCVERIPEKIHNDQTRLHFNPSIEGCDILQATQYGLLESTAYVKAKDPSLALSFVTVLRPIFVTQMFAPSKAIACAPPMTA